MMTTDDRLFLAGPPASGISIPCNQWVSTHNVTQHHYDFTVEREDGMGRF